MIGIKYDPNQPHRYVRYARMSSDLQNARSPDQQFGEIDRQLQRSGHSWIHLVDYRDDALSGRLMSKRPGFSQMLDDIKSGRLKVDLILVDTIERFGRMQELAALRHELQVKFGVLILTVDSAFSDPTSVAGTALGVVESIRATTHGETLAHNVRRGKRDAATQKHWPGGPAPCGYQLQSVMKPGFGPAEVDHRVLVPDERTAPIIRKEFQLAHDNGWGGLRIAKHLNADEAWVAQYGATSSASVDFHLSNPIYKGVLRYNRVRTGIADDRRVSARNDAAEVEFIPEFCDPLVEPAVFDAVQKMRRVRSEQIRAARKRKLNSNGKQISPVAPGVVLKHPLTGLVRCGVCGGSMRPSSNLYGKRRYTYYCCPNQPDGRCANGRRIRSDWLWSVFVARLREQLFPLETNSDGRLPGWLGDLMAEVRAELVKRAEHKQEQRPQFERELIALTGSIGGWTQSLANTELSAAVRVHLEHEFGAAMARKQQVEAELATLAHEVKRVDDVLDVDTAIERLHRLSEMLGDANATMLNLELSRHVEQIAVHPDGRVVMRTHWLGVFEGVTRLLAVPPGSKRQDAEEAEGSTNGNVKPRSALLARHDPGLVLGDRDAPPRPDLGFVRLPDRWIDEHVVVTPKRHTFAHLHATEVLALKHETGWSNARLARHFDVTGPTIRHALQIARQQETSGHE